MNYENIIYKEEGNIAMLIFDRPKALNAINAEVVSEFDDIVRKIETNDNIRAVILSGSGKAFIAGADISRMKDYTVKEAYDFMLSGQEILIKIEQSKKPYIAAINGYALGGGLEIAMACDIRLASETAEVGQPELLLGITPAWGGMQRLVRLVGKGIAKEIVFGCNKINAKRAWEIGLVNKIVAPNKLMEEAVNMANTFAKMPRHAIKMAKYAIESGYDMDNTSANRFEAGVCGLCFGTDEQKEGMEAFLEKRKPLFK
jgi:enoyl-CoA hydratase